MSHRLAVFMLASASLAVALPGCACDPVLGFPDAPALDAARLDAPVDTSAAPDSGMADVASVDVWLPDAAMVDAPAPDARLLPDAPTDAGFDCSTCRAAGPCELLRCLSSCEYEPVEDGVACGALDVCVRGVCEARGCGDGWREDGTGGVAFEACDDGNRASDDGCSSSCVPEVRTVTTVMGARDVRLASGRPAAAYDDEGNLLVAWIERNYMATNNEVHLRRYDRDGAVVDASSVLLDVAPSTNEALPTVLGLASGWAVAWPAWMPAGDIDGQGIVLTRVPPTGPVPSETLVNVGDTALSQERPSLARIASGFVVAWSSNQVPRQNIAYRMYSPDGAPRGALIHARPVDMTQEAWATAIGRGGDGWTLAYAEGFADTRLRAIDFEGSAGGAPYTLRYDQSGDPTLARGEGETVLLLDQRYAAGRMLILPFADGARPVDDAGFSAFGGARLERSAGLGAMAGGQFFALWEVVAGSPRFEFVVSPGATRPAGAAELEAALLASATPTDFSVNRVSARLRDGWIVTYAVGQSVYTFRLAPAP